MRPKLLVAVVVIILLVHKAEAVEALVAGQLGAACGAEGRVPDHEVRVDAGPISSEVDKNLGPVGAQLAKQIDKAPESIIVADEPLGHEPAMHRKQPILIHDDFEWD